MKADQKEYRDIFKTTSVFGGVQIITIIIGIAKTKVIAILLGPTGIGIMGLYTAAMQLINSTTGLGLNISAVRDVSEANKTGNINRIGQVVKVLRRWIVITGIVGMIITIIGSSQLSFLSFGDRSHTSNFIWLSLAILMQAINLGQLALLRGLRRIAFLAKTQILSALFGLVLSVPLFYFYGNEGIVPSLLIVSFVSLLSSWYFSKKIKVEQVIVSIKETWLIGRGMLNLGVFMTISSVAATAVAFLVKIFISKLGTIDDVGFYQAGWAISATYLGLVFTSMSTDYYPKLSGIHNDNNKVRELVNQQGIIALLFLGPLIITMLIALPLVIIVLYSKEFMPILEMTKWFLVGTLLKAGSWAVSFIFLAKADGKLFVFNELGIKVINLPLYYFSFKYFGLEGLGVAFALNYLIYFVWVYLVALRNYNFHYNVDFWRILSVQLFLTSIFLVSSYFIDSYLIYVIGMIVFIAISWFSIFELDKRINLIHFIKSKLNK